MRKRVAGSYDKANPKIDILSRERDGTIRYRTSTNYFSHVHDAVESLKEKFGNNIFGRINKGR